MKTGVVLAIYFHSIVCSVIVKRYSDDSVSENNHVSRTEVTPYIRHREQDTSKDINTRYIDQLFDKNLRYCQRPATCQPLNYTTCMGAKLPYHSTTLNLTDLTSQDKVQEKLQLYNYLRFIPKCWAVIQPFLCSLYMPKCEKNMVNLPSREMCKITLEPCKILYNSSVFPEFLNCDDERLFPTRCKNDIQEVKFNTTGFCMDPLIITDKPEWWFPDVEGCGLKCKDSLYTETEHNQIHKFIAVCASICLILNTITVMTFVIDWKTSNKYPASAIFYVNVCFCISYGGWLIQFLGSETREDIVCKREGTLRKSEPSANENLSCPVVFFMVYYFMIAGLVWFVIFSYAWYMSSLQALAFGSTPVRNMEDLRNYIINACRVVRETPGIFERILGSMQRCLDTCVMSEGKIQERVDRKQAYFHLAAWSLPLIFTIITMAISEIDGDYVTGICFVGFVNMAARTGLLLFPVVAAVLVSGYIIVRGLILLIKVEIDSQEIISEHSSRKIRMNIVRMGVFTLFMIIFCIVTFGYHHYIFEHSDLWKISLGNYVLCKLTSFSSDHTHCKLTSRPSVAKLQLQLIAVFGSGVAMASWVWCGAMLHSWGRYIRRKFHCEEEEPIKLKKHKIIAQAFAQRKKFNEGGKISISENHTDPVGLKFELNSAASNELSMSWAANLPRLVNRRGAVPNEVVYSASSRDHSMDSEVSVSLRHVSIESRRNSGDSQVSVQIAELKATRKVNSRRHRRPKATRHKSSRHFRSNSRNLTHTSRRLSKTESKQGSTTSIDSHLQLIHALTNKSYGRSFQPNLNRRTANVGLDGQNLPDFLSSGKLVIPYSRNKYRSESEDENVSVTISESTFNMKLSNHTNNLDLNDELVMKSLCQGVHIEELTSSTDSEESVLAKKDPGTEKRSKSGRESHSSKRSKRSRVSRKKYSSNSESCVNKSDSSSCNEINQLMQSSFNSANSAGNDKNRGSRQSKTSTDVAVQANAHDIVSQTAAYDLELKTLRKTDENKHKTKQTKTRENTYRKASKLYDSESSRKLKKSKEKYRSYGSSEERKSLNGDSEEEILVKDKSRVHVRKSKEATAGT